jgi:glycerate kinase
MKPFRILIAPTAFKGTLSAPCAAEIIQSTLATALPDAILDSCPMADGGDDTLAVLQVGLPALRRFETTVTGPLPDQTVTALYGVLPKERLAIIEAAQAHGMVRLPRKGDQLALSPMQATSYGAGQLIRQVIHRWPGLETLIVSLGGSASTDGGAGALQALGIRFYDATGKLIADPIGGGALNQIDRADFPPIEAWPQQLALRILTDVTNPLLGPNGSAAVFSPQKGAAEKQVEQLEAGLAHFARCLPGSTERNLTRLPGAGAAGGLAFGLAHLPNATIDSGFEWLSQRLDLSERIASAHLVITGEGRLDSQSLSGKVTGSLIRLAAGRPVWVVCGQAAPDLVLPPSVHVLSLASVAHNEQESLQAPGTVLRRALEQAFPAIQATLHLGG